MSTMLESMTSKINSALGLEEEPADFRISTNANKALDDFTLSGTKGDTFNDQGYNTSRIERAVDDFQQGREGDVIDKDGYNVSLIERGVKQGLETPMVKEESSWKDWMPDASWDKLPQAQVGAAAPRAGGRGGYRHKDQAFYNFVGDMTNMSDPLNSQLNKRIVGSQKQKLGL